MRSREPRGSLDQNLHDSRQPRLDPLLREALGLHQGWTLKGYICRETTESNNLEVAHGSMLRLTSTQAESAIYAEVGCYLRNTGTKCYRNTTQTSGEQSRLYQMGYAKFTNL